MAANNLALVLGGGGAAGHAWLIGMIAGMAEAGVDVTRADLVIGTSAGATAGVHVRSGQSPAELFASIMYEPARPSGQAGPPAHSAIAIDTVFERMRAIGAAATSALDLQRAMGAFALESDALLGASAAEQRRAMVAARLPRKEWPDEPLIVTAVDAHSGELVPFDRHSGVALVDAVNASTAAPGMVPTVEINGARYIDGGIRSVENADLAAGHASVVVLSPLGDRGPPRPGQFEGLRREAEWRTTLASQVDYLRAQGSRVEAITPHVAARAAIGPNPMDFAARIPSARAGFAQGRRDAARVAG